MFWALSEQTTGKNFMLSTPWLVDGVLGLLTSRAAVCQTWSTTLAALAVGIATGILSVLPVMMSTFFHYVQHCPLTVGS
jgi:hypothetical protein